MALAINHGLTEHPCQKTVWIEQVTATPRVSVTPEFLRLETGLKLRGSLISKSGRQQSRFYIEQLAKSSKSLAITTDHLLQVLVNPSYRILCSSETLGCLLVFSFPFLIIASNLRCTFLWLDIDKLPPRRPWLRANIPPRPIALAECRSFVEIVPEPTEVSTER